MRTIDSLELDILTLETLAGETHKALVELARLRPDAKIIVKSKSSSPEFDETFRMLGGHGVRLPQNLQVVVGGDPFNLITASSVVIGFNTTALFEAIAADKPVIVPRFGEACSARAWEYVVDLGTAAEYASCPQELCGADQPAFR